MFPESPQKRVGILKMGSKGISRAEAVEKILAPSERKFLYVLTASLSLTQQALNKWAERKQKVRALDRIPQVLFSIIHLRTIYLAPTCAPNCLIFP